jgi:hypothetical protein
MAEVAITDPNQPVDVMGHYLHEASQRMKDEVGLVKLLRVSPERAKFYSEPRTFPDTVSTSRKRVHVSHLNDMRIRIPLCPDRRKRPDRAGSISWN